MIVIMQGVPGSGKSYEAVVYHILPALQRGRKVITNMPLNVEVFAEFDPAFADLIEIRMSDDPKRAMFSRASDYDSQWEGTDAETGMAMHPLIVIDECHEALPPRAVPDDVKNVYAMHRHRGFDIVLMTQNYRDIERSIIHRADHMIEVRNNKARGFKNRYTRFFYRKVTDRKPELVQTRLYEAKYFPLYQSYTQGGSGLELGSVDVKKWWSHPIFWLGGPIAVILFSVAIWGAWSVGSKFLGEKEPPARQAAGKPVSAPGAQVGTPGGPPNVSATNGNYPSGLAGLHYAGVIQGSKGVQLLTKDDAGAVTAHPVIGLDGAGWGVTEFGPCYVVLKRKATGDLQRIVCR